MPWHSRGTKEQHFAKTTCGNVVMQLNLPGTYFLHPFVWNRTYGIYIFVMLMPSVWDACNGRVYGMSQQSIYYTWNFNRAVISVQRLFRSTFCWFERSLAKRALSYETCTFPNHFRFCDMLSIELPASNHISLLVLPLRSFRTFRTAQHQHCGSTTPSRSTFSSR